jgi:Kef-type K+ transport system membrane component KefB
VLHSGVMHNSLLGLVVVFGMVAVAPIVTAVLGRLVRVPLVVVEIILGLLVGPAVLGWVAPEGITSSLSGLGVAALFFLSGYEIDYQRIVGRPLVRAGLGWVVSLLAGGIVGIGLAILLGSASVVSTGVLIGICLTSTALGTIMPTLRDAHEVNTGFGRAVIASGAVGQFGPLLAVAVLLGGRHPLASVIALVVFAIVVGLGIWLASHGLPAPLARLVSATLHTSGQLGVRVILFVLIGLVLLSVLLGLDTLLGAFSAGALTRLLLAGSPASERKLTERRLEGIGYGFLVPIFFVQTGVTFDLQGLMSQPVAFLLIPVFLILFLIVRGIPGSATLPRRAPSSERMPAILLTATGLAVIVAVANTGAETGSLPPTVAAALIGAGLCSVLLFPTIALALRRRHSSVPIDPLTKEKR